MFCDMFSSTEGGCIHTSPALAKVMRANGLYAPTHVHQDQSACSTSDGLQPVVKSRGSLARLFCSPPATPPSEPSPHSVFCYFCTPYLTLSRNSNNPRVMQGAAQRQKQREEALAKQKQQEKERAEAKDRGNASRGGIGFAGQRAHEVNKIGDFEKHTKGIGMKLLEKMGYKKGGGLGKDGKGMVAPMETKMRPKAMGMGYNDFKEAGQMNNRQEEKKPREQDAREGQRGSIADQLAAEDLRKREERQAHERTMWKKRNELQRQRREYRTAEEVLAEQERADAAAAAAAGGASVVPPKMTIIDMRGAQAQVVTDLAKLDADPRGGGDGGGGDDDALLYMPELQHNLRLIVDLAEAEIQTLDAKIRHEKDTKDLLARERRRLAGEAERCEEAAVQLAEVLKLAEKCEAAAGGGASLGDMAQMWAELKGNYEDEYTMYGLSQLALAHAHPLVSRTFGASWDPMKEVGRGMEEMKAWRDVLLGKGTGKADSGPFAFGAGDDDADPMTRLLAEPVIQPLRAALTTRWDPRDPEPALRFFETWDGVLPDATAEGLFHGTVFPKLQQAVDTWDPTKDPVPIHTWTHPWLPYLGAAMDPLWAPIRHKLTNALVAWHPSDGSALVLLAPWRRVFSAKDWEALIMRSILPKLQFALDELVVNPADQSLDQINWVLAWEKAVPGRLMVALLDSRFFPKWQAVLHQWLTSAAPDLEEVTQWYLGWKSLFSEELLAHERVRRQLNVALDMMNQAVSGEGVVRPPTAQTKPVKEPKAVESEAAPSRAKGEMEVDVDISLREAVEAFAEAHDLSFLPKPGRVVEGLQVYAFGKVSVTVDNARQMLRAQVGERWAPVSMDQLLEHHKERLRAKSKVF